MEKYYKFRNNTLFTHGYTWAMSIIPKSSTDSFSCPECGIRHNAPSGAFDVIVEGGSKYPDVLGCGAYPFLILSEAIINDWKEAGINAFATFPVNIAKVKSKKLLSVHPPRYFRVEITGTCKINLEASGYSLLPRSTRCNHSRLEKIGTKGMFMVPGSWDGTPLFRDHEIFPRLNFCTEIIVELARKHKRTNFRFVLLEDAEDPPGKGLEYLK